MIPQHSHCQICGKPVPLSETLCSEDCKEKYSNIVKKRKRQIAITYGFIIITFIILLLVLNIF